MKIRIDLGEISLEGMLDDSSVARDLASLLPLTLALEDHARTEKISYLPRKLNIAGAPAGVTPAAGDLCYYAPWGNLALFYRPFEYSEGLVRLGTLDEGVAVLQNSRALSVKLELVEE